MAPDAIPGVYVEEGNVGPPSIEGVPTGAAAMLGETARGPLKPRRVTSVREFERRFGGETGNDRYLPDAVTGFFENGGRELYVCRIVGKRATPSRGVFKAAGNATLQGVLGVAEDLSDPEQQALAPRGVNVIRDFGARGTRVWGARTMSSDPLWKYVNVRRLLVFIERSIDEGTQWVVFEPNDARSWARVKAAIRDFLVRLWRDGALVGSKEEEACFVTCDETTMTQDDIVHGRLVCEVGIAPVRPAEFVVFRVLRFTADDQR